MRKLRILLSAYACDPYQGSEPYFGWNVAREVSKYHEVWVITAGEFRPAIEAGLANKSVPELHFVYCDLPSWSRWWKKGLRGDRIYYYLWQIAAYFLGRKLNRETNFDLVHHITYTKYSMPSLLALLPTPFVWGPVGGGESAPKPFWKGFGLKGIAYETARVLMRWLGENDPFTRLTSRRAVSALATTEETAARMRKIGGARNVQILPLTALLSDKTIEQLGRYVPSSESPVRFISMGRLVHWKGFHLALQAFAEAELAEAEYWMVGDGPERRRLEVLAQQLQISDKVRFWGSLSQQEAWVKLGESHVLVHPSLHESGGYVVTEAMAASRPVICLNLGGPALGVTEETGFRVSARVPKQTIADLAEAMRCLGSNRELRESMGRAGRERVLRKLSLAQGVQELITLYAGVTRRAKQ